jgi:hypothetical protein
MEKYNLYNIGDEGGGGGGWKRVYLISYILIVRSDQSSQLYIHKNFPNSFKLPQMRKALWVMEK